MKLTEVLRPECVRTGLVIDDKALALCEVASLAKKNPLCRHISEEDILEGLQERETLGSTAFGGGVAIPHCRLKALNDFVVGILTVPGGVDFESADRKKVRLMVFILAPTDQPNAHIRLLSSISRALQNVGIVDKMVRAKSPGSLIEILSQAAGPEIPLETPSQKSMLHVFVQDVNIFEKILSALSGLETLSMAILSAENVQETLTKMPLYAEFAKNGISSVCRVLVVIAEHRLDNEIIRRIEGITGPLQKCSGVMATIQPLSYAAGSLEP
jgi:mannitol/fructose-specific phosphotransferase system IIA component (Ntr-type)